MPDNTDTMQHGTLRLRNFGLSILALIFILSALPFLIPIPAVPISPAHKPFINSRFIEINNTRIHYRTWQPKAKSKGLVLMIHGFAENTFTWRKNIDTLIAQNYAVVLADLPAFGYSEKSYPLDKSFWAQAMMMNAFLDSICIREPYAPIPKYLVGHSMGCGVVLAMAALKPQKYAAILLVDGAMLQTKFKKQTVAEKILSIAYKYEPVLKWIDIWAYQHYTYSFFEKRISSAYGRAATAEEVTRYYMPFTMANSGRALVYYRNEALAEIQLDYAQIQIPVYILWGGMDTWIDIKTGEYLVRTLPNAQMHVIANAAHNPMETHSSEFNAWMVEAIINGKN